MFHLRTLELLHWDYCRRVQLPLDAAIVTIAGPNGSGKTTLLDALRTLLGLDCSGGRNYKTYARHNNAQQVWLRATVDNRPRGAQRSSRPFATSLLWEDRVTLACRIERAAGDWQRRYAMAEGDVAIEALLDRPAKEWLGVEDWRKRLAHAGLTPAVARVLSLEQGQTDRLCEFSPRELLKLVFDVFGDQEVLDRYGQAKSHQQQLAREVAQGEGELAHASAHLESLRLRVVNWQQRQHKLRERERLAAEVIPVLQWAEARAALSREVRELHRQRLRATADARGRAEQRRQLLNLHEVQREAAIRVERLSGAVQSALDEQRRAREVEQPLEALVQRETELAALAAIEGDTAALAERMHTLQEQSRRLDQQFAEQDRERTDVERELAALQDTRVPPPPEDVRRFRQSLRAAGLEHDLLADVVEVRDDRWRAAVEGVLRPLRWMVMLHTPDALSQAFQLAERERYRNYVVVAGDRAGKGAAASLLAVIDFAVAVPIWLAQQLRAIRRVESIDEGRAGQGEWITPAAYFFDGRGGRSVWLDPSQHQFGAAALAARRSHLEQRLAGIGLALTATVTEMRDTQRQLEDVREALQGRRAAEELLRRAGEFAQARAALPALAAARAAAGRRWQAANESHVSAVREDEQARVRYEAAQCALGQAEQEAERAARDWQTRRTLSKEACTQSGTQRHGLPAAWRSGARIDGLRAEFGNVQQARLRAQAIETELAGTHWELDDTVEERHRLMDATVREQRLVLEERKAGNELARIAAHNARERYIDVLRATVRRYRRNIAELGQLAGVEVQAEPPHLDNDDAVLAQAGLTVKFSFDGKGAVGLMKDAETPGGFVFIDEPFAHLDVRNIQLVGHFLRSTRAQYLLTTPITHNVEVFEPAEITLVTSKKQRGERWAPPIAVLQRRMRVDAASEATP